MYTTTVNTFLYFFLYYATFKPDIIVHSTNVSIEQL